MRYPAAGLLGFLTRYRLEAISALRRSAVRSVKHGLVASLLLPSVKVHFNKHAAIAIPHLDPAACRSVSQNFARSQHGRIVIVACNLLR